MQKVWSGGGVEPPTFRCSGMRITAGQEPCEAKIVTGWGSMAKEREAAGAVIAQLNQDHGGVEVR